MNSPKVLGNCRGNRVGTKSKSGEKPIDVWLSVIGYRSSDFGYRISVIGFRSSDFGYRTLVYATRLRLSLSGTRSKSFVTTRTVIGHSPTRLSCNHSAVSTNPQRACMAPFGQSHNASHTSRTRSKSPYWLARLSATRLVSTSFRRALVAPLNQSHNGSHGYRLSAIYQHLWMLILQPRASLQYNVLSLNNRGYI